jgi:hypothetical protein
MSEEYKGGEQGYEGDGPNVRLDDFVGRIVQDPSQPPELLLLSGYLGASSEEGHVRLYLDEELSRYVELPEKAIRHTQELPPEQSPLGGSLVWLDRGAEVLHGSASEERRKATFLEGQIAQDFIGAGSGEGAQQEGGGEAGAAAPTRLLGCQSAFNPCIPPTEFGPNCQSSFQICNTLTGIFCTRFGPGCRRTAFEPGCTAFGPNCRTVQIVLCESRFITSCISRVPADCVFGNPSVDLPCPQTSLGPGCRSQVAFCTPNTRDECVFQAAAFAGPGGGGFGDPFGGGGGGFQTGFNCPSVFDNCATQDSFCQTQSLTCQSVFVQCPTRSPIQCQFETRFCQSVLVQCPTLSFRCPTRPNPRCISQINLCADTRVGCQFDTAVNCPTFDIQCQTQSGPRCTISRVAVCDVTRDCTFQTAACGFEPGFGPQAPVQGTEPGGGTDTRFCPSQVSSCRAPTFAGPCASAVDACPTRIGCPSQQGCPGGGRGGGGGGGGRGAEEFGGGAERLLQTRRVDCFPSQFIRCASALDACPTRFNCPSRLVVCQSQFIRCASALDACPTRFNCPSVTSPCVTQDFSCETRGRCPSAVDACPTRFGCFDTQVCGVSLACFPGGGGGGGFDPGGGGFGGGGGF